MLINEMNNTKGYIDKKINDLVNGAPETMDTLKEIADAMDENADVVEALNNAIGNKASIEYVDSVVGDITTLINNL